MAVRKLTCAGTTCVESTDGETIEYRIQQMLADNNAGNISAADVRNNLIDIVDSIIENVASGDFSSTGKPFKNDLNLAVTTDPVTSNQTGGELRVGSGIYFDTTAAGALGLAAGEDRIQRVPYPGPGQINHNDLSGLDLLDPHPQYVSRSGDSMTGNLGMGGYDDVTSNWISSKGVNETSQTLGIKFVNQGNVDIGGDATKEHVVLGSGTTLEFDKDSSTIASAVPTAHAFIRFEGANPPVVKSSYNIQSLRRVDQGKYEIYFKPSARFSPGLADYVVVAHANGTSSAGGIEDMDLVNAASVERSGDVFSLVVQNDAGNYVDSKLNDVVVFGIASGVNTVEHPIATVI